MSCKLDPNTGTATDQDGTEGCDSTCDPNGKDKDGADCGVTPAVTCTFFDNATDSGYTCTDGKSCTLDELNVVSVDQDGTEGCDSTCDANGKDKDGADCTSTRRLAAQAKLLLGQN